MINTTVAEINARFSGTDGIFRPEARAQLISARETKTITNRIGRLHPRPDVSFRSISREQAQRNPPAHCRETRPINTSLLWKTSSDGVSLAIQAETSFWMRTDPLSREDATSELLKFR